MTHHHELNATQVHSSPLWVRMLQGAGIAFVFIAIFLFGVNDPNPEWGKFWMLRPLIIVPIAGAMGGIFYYFMGHMRSQGGLKKALGIILSLIGYLVIVWLGTVLGLDGTLWD